MEQGTDKGSVDNTVLFYDAVSTAEFRHRL
jgi:hypothetical protein